MVVVVVTVAVIVVYHRHYWHLTLWLVAWRVSACVKLEIKIIGTHLCGMGHPHILQGLRNVTVLSL